MVRGGQPPRDSETCTVPAERVDTERELFGELPSLRLEVGPKPTTRKVDKLSRVRFGSARYSVPNRLIGTTVTVLVDERDRVLRVIEPVTGEVHAEHALVASGETSIVDEHYDRPRPDTPRRGARPRTPVEWEFLALARAGCRAVPDRCRRCRSDEAGHRDRRDPHHGCRARRRAAACRTRARRGLRRWRAADVRSILATNGHAPRPTPAGQALVLTLPSVPTRSLDAYRIDATDGGEVS